ncbi:hypothetical protein [Burkholderia pseudomallei]|uniref:hypothetical protein n=1 Tax=Burkholderia pseudomallei TaxID=28450 RepID=UPI001E41395C|nr:hypothetical protein [Burkholderia pseudomallei]
MNNCQQRASFREIGSNRKMRLRGRLPCPGVSTHRTHDSTKATAVSLNGAFSASYMLKIQRLMDPGESQSIFYRRITVHIKSAATFVSLVLFLHGCTSIDIDQLASHQHDQDENRCRNYGYQIGTNKFADCMMLLDQERRSAAIAEDENDERLKSLSIMRNNDERFPVCVPTMPNVKLDVPNHSWYGPNCRER